jgi:hypothetical protein
MSVSGSIISYLVSLGNAPVAFDGTLERSICERAFARKRGPDFIVE